MVGVWVWVFVCMGVWMGGVLQDATTTCSLCWISLCAACLYIITRPDSQLLCTRVYYFMWFSLTWSSATLWWQLNACNCSMFCACTRSGTPHNVVHFLVMVLVFARVLVCRWDDVTSSIVPGCTVMVVLDIPWSRVRVMVLACCGIMVRVFTGS